VHNFVDTQLKELVASFVWVCKQLTAINLTKPPIYRVSTKSFPDYKHLLQDNLNTSRLCNCNVTINTRHKILETNLSNKKICLYST
jgi:hypothetical protein